MHRILIYLLLIPIFGHSQTNQISPIHTEGPVIEFDKTEHNFGLVGNQTAAVHKFKFKNTGNKDLYINKVESQCGCTSPSWTDGAIKPGQEGFVEAKYDAPNHPGDFRKSLAVYSNAINKPFIQLIILGDVKESEIVAEKSVVPDFGAIYFEMATARFEPLLDNQIDSMEVKLINKSQFATSIYEMSELPKYLKVKGIPESLEPMETVSIKFIIDGTKIKGYGFNGTTVSWKTTNPNMINLSIVVGSIRKQYFPKYNKRQMKKQAHLSIDKPHHDFGKQISGGFLTCKFTFTNTGKKKLIFHEIYPNCGCVKVIYPKRELEPGESMELEIIYDTVLKTDLKYEKIWIVCNDPAQDEREIFIKTEFPPKHTPPCATCTK